MQTPDVPNAAVPEQKPIAQSTDKIVQKQPPASLTNEITPDKNVEVPKYAVCMGSEWHGDDAEIHGRTPD